MIRAPIAGGVSERKAAAGRRLALAALVAAAVACGPGRGQGQEDLEHRAKRLAHDLLIVDTHIDLPYRLSTRPADVGFRNLHGDLDYVRAREGGLDVAFLSIYVPASDDPGEEAKQAADALIDGVERIVAEHPDKFTLVRSPRDDFRRSPKVRLALGMENGDPLVDRLENLTHFHERGVRYITLAHSKSNRIADSSFDTARPWNGLSPFGREVVREMNRLGIMVDVSHVSDAAFEQVVELSRAPVLASHSSCRHFTPGWERNMSDEMIRRLAAAGGVIQINFGSMFLDDRYRREFEERERRIEAELDASGIARDSAEARAFAEEFQRKHPLAPVGVGAVADHIDHVVRLVGIDHVGLGSDFDGVGDALPEGLSDVSQYPNLIAVLLARGYTSEQVVKVCAGNLLRVWREAERVARELEGQPAADGGEEGA